MCLSDHLIGVCLSFQIHSVFENLLLHDLTHAVAISLFLESQLNLTLKNLNLSIILEMVTSFSQFVPLFNVFLMA